MRRSRRSWSCCWCSPLAALAAALGHPPGSRARRSAGRCSGLTLDYYRELFINRRHPSFMCPRSTRRATRCSMPGRPCSSRWAWVSWRPTRSPAAGGSTRVLDPLLMLPLGARRLPWGWASSSPSTARRSSCAPRPCSSRWPTAWWRCPSSSAACSRPSASIPARLRQAAAVAGGFAAAGLAGGRPADRYAGRRWCAAIFAFTISLGEFGATSLLARPEYPTLPVAIFRFLSQPGALNYGQAMAMATLLMVVCGAGDPGSSSGCACPAKAEF